MRRAALSLGSNLGDRERHLAAGVASFSALPDTVLVALSDVYETDPVGGPAQDAFLNAVLIVDTGLHAHALLAMCHSIEAEHGRERVQVWGPRTLDIDVLALGDEEMDGDVVLPHPRAHERAFVLVPWATVAPDMQIPGHGRVGDIVASVGSAGVRWFCPADRIAPESAA